MQSLVTRPMEPRDAVGVLELVNADRIPGQPSATVEALREAAAGRSSVDAGWWEELDHPVAIDVAEASAEDLIGVVSYAVRPMDQTGLILWLHGREDSQVVGRLIDHALAQMPEARQVEAFAIASALGLGLEALPVGHRPVTAKALTMKGFVAEPGTARDRTAANQLYEGAGFVEVDRLHSFRLRR